MSRMVYGLAHGSKINPKYLAHAQRAAQFILNKMVRRDHIGPYFLSAVNAQGDIVPNDRLKIDEHGRVDRERTRLLVNEQAYGLNGLVALYQVTRDDKVLRNDKLLETIRELYAAF
jgi:hypothetical protein